MLSIVNPQYILFRLRRISRLHLLEGLVVCSLLIMPSLAYSLSNEKGDDGWTFELGFGGELESQYAGSDNRQLEPDPYINIAFRKGPALWYTSIQDYGVYYSLNQRWLLGLSAGLEVGRDEDDDPALRGLGQIDDTWELRLDAAYRVNNTVTLGARAMTAGADKDNVYFVAAIVDLPTPSDTLELTLTADISWASQQHLQTEFGVTQQQSVGSGYPEYRPSSGLKSYGLATRAKLWLDRSWFTYSEISFERYGDAGSNSPYVKNKSDYEAELGIAYRF